MQKNINNSSIIGFSLFLCHLCFGILFFLLSPFTFHLSPLQLSPVYASDEPFTGPSNWGGTGLMEIPTARMLKDNRFRVGISNVRPYQTYYVTVGLFDRLEINGRVTEILGTEVSPGDPGWKDYGNYKDKALDFKYQFLKEGMYMPALSIGINDPHGTRLYPSQFIIASKQIYPFDFTLGFGNGRFGKSPLPSQGEGFKIEMFDDTKGWFKDSQPFWGIQFALSEKYAFMMEYNPIRYEKQTGDPAQAKYFQEPAPSKFNFGFRWKPVKNAEFDVSYQRGEQIGFNLSLPFDIGEPMIPIYNKSYIEPPAYKTGIVLREPIVMSIFAPTI